MSLSGYSLGSLVSYQLIKIYWSTLNFSWKKLHLFLLVVSCNCRVLDAVSLTAFWSPRERIVKLHKVIVTVKSEGRCVKVETCNRTRPARIKVHTLKNCLNSASTAFILNMTSFIIQLFVLQYFRGIPVMFYSILCTFSLIL